VDLFRGPVRLGFHRTHFYVPRLRYAGVEFFHARFYDEHLWGCHGMGEFGLSQLSDRLGRKPVILLGLVSFSTQFLGMAFFKNTILIAVSFMVAGFGNALFDPALSASLLDITPTRHQARTLGIKSAAGSLGSI
jgi:MFS family permease